MGRAPQQPPSGPEGTATAAPSTSAARLRAGLREPLHRHRRLLWPAAALLLLCVLSGPLLGAWMRWVELPRIAREADLQPCAQAATAAGGAAKAGEPGADAIVAALDAQETALAPRQCLGMRRIDTGTGLRTAAYRFADGSLFTLHLRAPATAAAAQGDAQRGMAVDAVAGTAADTATDAPTERPTQPGTAANAGTAVGIDAGNSTDTAIDPAGAEASAGANADAVPAPADTRAAQPAPRPILAATCPVQSRQSLLVLAGLLIVGVVVVLHRLRAGGRFFDFRNVVSEPLRPGEALLLLYAFTVILGTGIGLQIGGCEAAEHRDAVKVDRTPASLKELVVPRG